MYEAVTSTTPTFAVSRRLLFELPWLPGDFYYRRWDLAPDGSHFLMTRPLAAASIVRPPETTVIHNWVADVRERLGTR
jgi:hypothetical protein